jgi:sarcosine oxidase
VIVLGVGGAGSAAVFELARRGRRVLGLEQFGLVHDRGSSHGQTRVTRKAYYEHPAYVPLLQRAYQRWYDLEQRANQRLLVECGCLSIGPPDGTLIAGVRRSAEEHGLPVEHHAPADIRRRFPQFRFGDEYSGILEREAGFLYVEDCVQAHVDEAVRLGATVRAEEPVLDWKPSGSGVTVRTAKATYHAAKLVVTAGGWATRLLADIGVRLTVMRQVLLWFGVSDPAAFRRDVFPIFITDMPEGHFYGFPVIDAAGGLKVARHYGAPELPDPDAIDRTPHADDQTPVRGFLGRHLPDANGPLRQSQVCIYTLTPDRHFVIDAHPAHANVVICSSCSGHGFKFTSVLGEALADLAESGRTHLPIDMFRLKRFV